MLVLMILLEKDYVPYRKVLFHVIIKWTYWCQFWGRSLEEEHRESIFLQTPGCANTHQILPCVPLCHADYVYIPHSRNDNQSSPLPSKVMDRILFMGGEGVWKSRLPIYISYCSKNSFILYDDADSLPAKILNNPKEALSNNLLCFKQHKKIPVV